MKDGYVYDQVLKLRLDNNCSQIESRNAAQMANEDYKKGKYTSVSKLINGYLNQAIKNTKQFNKAKK